MITQGMAFEFQGQTYSVDLIGPKQTLLLRGDGAWQLVETLELQQFLFQREEVATC